MTPKKICLIAVGKLPVPATQGGAVEGLVQTLLEQNERTPQLELTVLAMREPQAQQQAAQYSHAQFVWFAPHKLWNKVWWRWRALRLRLSGTETAFPYQRRQAARWLKKHAAEFDAFVAESELEIVQEAGLAPEKVLYHLHWVGRPTPARDAAFGTLVGASRFVCAGWCAQTGRAPATARVLPNCADLAAFGQRLPAEERLALRKELGIGANDFVVLFTGRMIPDKGVRELLRAVEQLPDDGVALVLVGGADFGLRTATAYEAEVRDLAQRSRKTVRPVGFVPHSEVWFYHQIADVAVQPSLCQEAAGLAAVEAMASGLPVVATRVGGVPEYLGEGCGILLAADDTLTRSLTESLQFLRMNPEVRARLGAAGQAWAQHFSPEAYYRDFVEIVQGGGQPLAEE